MTCQSVSKVCALHHLTILLRILHAECHGQHIHVFQMKHFKSYVQWSIPSPNSVASVFSNWSLVPEIGRCFDIEDENAFCFQ